MMGESDKGELMNIYYSAELLSKEPNKIEFWGVSHFRKGKQPELGTEIEIKKKTKLVLDLEYNPTDRNHYRMKVKCLGYKYKESVEEMKAEGAGDEWSDGLTLAQAVERAKKMGGLKIRRKNSRYDYDKWFDPDIDDISISDAMANDWLVEQKNNFKRIDVEAGIREAIRLTNLGQSESIAFKSAMEIAEEGDLGELVEEQPLD